MLGLSGADQEVEVVAEEGEVVEFYSVCVRVQ